MYKCEINPKVYKLEPNLCGKRLVFPGGPVGSDRSAAQPLAVHRLDGGHGVHLADKADKAVALGLAGGRVFHHLAVGNFAERGERVPGAVNIQINLYFYIEFD